MDCPAPDICGSSSPPARRPENGMVLIGPF